MGIHSIMPMTKLVVSICCVQFLVLVAALATPGDDLLVAKLLKSFGLRPRFSKLRWFRGT